MTESTKGLESFLEDVIDTRSWLSESGVNFIVVGDLFKFLLSLLVLLFVVLFDFDLVLPLSVFTLGSWEELSIVLALVSNVIENGISWRKIVIRLALLLALGMLKDTAVVLWSLGPVVLDERHLQGGVVLVHELVDLEVWGSTLSVKLVSTGVSSAQVEDLESFKLAFVGEVPLLAGAALVGTLWAEGHGVSFLSVVSRASPSFLVHV